MLHLSLLTSHITGIFDLCIRCKVILSVLVPSFFYAVFLHLRLHFKVVDNCLSLYFGSIFNYINLFFSLHSVSNYSPSYSKSSLKYYLLPFSFRSRHLYLEKVFSMFLNFIHGGGSFLMSDGKHP